MRDKKREPQELADLMREASGGVACLSCGCRDSRVFKTRRHDGFVLRHRVCRHCGRTTLTAERPMGQPPKTCDEAEAGVE